jgi:hypothetical protein
MEVLQQRRKHKNSITKDLTHKLTIIAGDGLAPDGGRARLVPLPTSRADRGVPATTHPDNAGQGCGRRQGPYLVRKRRLPYSAGQTDEPGLILTMTFRRPPHH